MCVLQLHSNKDVSPSTPLEHFVQKLDPIGFWGGNRIGIRTQAQLITFGFDHINRNPPVLIRTPKLTRFEPAQYWGGGPPGNSVVLNPIFALSRGPPFRCVSSCKFLVLVVYSPFLQNKPRLPKKYPPELTNFWFWFEKLFC
jgi:hypothetical protein